MQCISAVAVLLAAAVSPGVDERPKATRVIEGQKTTFPAKSIPNGVKLLSGVLESCHLASGRTMLYTAVDLKKARKGDHVRFVFPKPLKVEVLGRTLKISEAVYAGGVFWLACGEDVVRCTKYTHDKYDPFLKWNRRTLSSD